MSDVPIVYTQEAIDHRISGLVIVKCTIGVDGTVSNCRVFKPMDYMTDAVVHALLQRRFKPSTFRGNPVAVDYVFNVRLKAPPILGPPPRQTPPGFPP